MAGGSTSGIAFVTGGAKRLGRAIALRLAANGWDVAIHCHKSRTDADTTAGEIKALGRRSLVLQADLAQDHVLVLEDVQGGAEVVVGGDDRARRRVGGGGRGRRGSQ